MSDSAGTSEEVKHDLNGTEDGVDMNSDGVDDATDPGETGDVSGEAAKNDGEGDDSSGDDGPEDEGDYNEEEDEEDEEIEMHEQQDEGSSSDSDDEPIYEDFDDDEGGEDGDGDIYSRISDIKGMMSSPFYQRSQYSSVDHILNKDDIVLEELLDVDDFLSDLRRGKTTLLNFLGQSEIMQRLITYISTEMDKEALDIEKQKRYAHLAYEAIQTDQLKEVIINNHSLLDKFFEFLDITAEMDPLRCAYFSRIVELLFERYPKALISYLKKKNCIVAKFVWHINNQYIVESLFRLIDSNVSHQWLHDEDLIPFLMFKMAESRDADTQEKTAGVLVEILDLFVPFPYSILTTQMFHSEIVAEQWEQFTLAEPTNFPKIQNGLNVAIGILNLSYEGNMADDTPIFMQQVVSKLDLLLDLLRTPTDATRTVEMTFGELTPPFGFLRLKILEFLSALLNTRYQSVIDSLWREDIFNTLLDLFFFYKWNNVLHFYFDQILCSMITLDSDGSHITDVLIKKCDLLGRIVDSFNNESDRTTGYHGHLVHISNELNKAATYHPDLKAVLDADERWQGLVNGRLKELNDNMNKPLVESPASMSAFPDLGGDELMSGISIGDGYDDDDDDLDLIEDDDLDDLIGTDSDEDDDSHTVEEGRE